METARPIKEGDLVRITPPGHIPVTYIIRSIFSDSISISAQDDPNSYSSLVPDGKGGWQLSGSLPSQNYIIEFIALSAIGTLFTGNPDVDADIISRLDDQFLIDACSLNSYARSLCDDDL